MKFDSEEVNETKVDREVNIEDSKATIDSRVKQKVDCDTFMEMFQNKVVQRQQLVRKIRDMENSIEEFLGEHGDDMQNMHAFDSSQEQSQLTEKVSRGSAVNSVPFEAIKTYTNLRKGKKQLEGKKNELEDVEEDLRELYTAAERIVEEYDSFEMPEIWEEKVREELLDEE